MESRTLKSCEQVLKSFAGVQAILSSVQGDVQRMRENVNHISNRLSTARLGASEVVAQTGDLRKKLSNAEKRAQVATLFFKRFLLSRSEEAILESAEISEEFLATLNKLERIHVESKSLLRCRNQRAGLEVVEMAAARREDAYERVYRFVQSRCGALDVESAEDEVESKLLRETIHTLKARPILLGYCADEVGAARRAILVERFVTALTRGGPAGVPRPIEMHAHDAMRYTNDMLAWIHQALASERELIMKLFSNVNESEASERKDGEETALKVLNTIFDALCRPFRVRFEQALDPQPPVVTLYKLASLLEFYAHTMMKLLGDDSGLPNTLLECNSLAMYAFFSSWRSRLESFQSAKPVPSEDLSPPIAVRQSMSRVKEIALTLDGSLSPAEAREEQIVAILEVILNPLITLCARMAAKHLEPVEREIFMANCIDTMRVPLVSFSFAASRAESLMADADAHIDRYIELSTASVLKSFGLYEVSEAIKFAQPGIALSRVPGLDSQTLAVGLNNFYAVLFERGQKSLANPERLRPPKIERISNSRMRLRVNRAVLQALTDLYAKIYKAMHDPENEYQVDQAGVLNPWDPQKVFLVLSGHFDLPNDM
mmetsp:Transcript_2289/g.9602  ORF Transcript_2289/g.9602 Transcript_2289/m.9602 type:complete len:604 (+) Transcript_2289:90-1901(+)